MDSWRPIMNIVELLEEALSGDLKRFLSLAAIEHGKLLESSKTLAGLFLTKLAVLNVLNGLKKFNIDPEIAQQWASFMKRGYIAANKATPILPLQIEYKPEDEDSIVEVLARLDELGDVIDGSIDEAEIDNLISLFD
jgi:hypothetical protein